MDSGLDVDDLFGDPALGLGLSSPSPPPKGLAQRLDEMRLLGCCQYVLPLTKPTGTGLTDSG